MHQYLTTHNRYVMMLHVEKENDYDHFEFQYDICKSL